MKNLNNYGAARKVDSLGRIWNRYSGNFRVSSSRVSLALAFKQLLCSHLYAQFENIKLFVTLDQVITFYNMLRYQMRWFNFPIRKKKGIRFLKNIIMLQACCVELKTQLFEVWRLISQRRWSDHSASDYTMEDASSSRWGGGIDLLPTQGIHPIIYYYHYVNNWNSYSISFVNILVYTD